MLLWTARDSVRCVLSTDRLGRMAVDMAPWHTSRAITASFEFRWAYLGKKSCDTTPSCAASDPWIQKYGDECSGWPHGAPIPPRPLMPSPPLTLTLTVSTTGMRSPEAPERAAAALADADPKLAFAEGQNAINPLLGWITAPDTIEWPLSSMARQLSDDPRSLASSAAHSDPGTTLQG